MQSAFLLDTQKKLQRMDDCSVLNPDPEKQLGRESEVLDNLRTYLHETMIIQTYCLQFPVHRYGDSMYLEVLTLPLIHLIIPIDNDKNLA